jgi:hypothetical protein
MNDSEMSNPISGPNLPMPQLEEILAEVIDALGELPPVSAVHALYVQVAQCRTAIAANRRHAFSPDVLRSLTAKVLHLETDVLAARRVLMGRSRRRGAYRR